jgi:transcriptional regulator with XRE-family HTH domain
MPSAPNSLRLLGDNVRKRRQQLRISQEELADRAGLHRTYIGGIERGERNIGFLNLVKLARALGVELSELLRDLK